jgi:hypothetical protein
MIVFHGSYTKIDKINLAKCEAGKDFGQGFYVTKFRDQAEFWAQRKGLYHGTKGYITEFDFYENAFEHFHLKTLRFSDYSEEWLDFVTLNRNPDSPIPAHDCDIVEGPIADDRIASRINDYLKGALTKQAFLKELKYHKETHQICFCTGRSLQMLVLRNSQPDINFYIEKMGEQIVTALMINSNMNEAEATDVFYTSSTFVKLADETTKLYLQSWQKIYEMLKQEITDSMSNL